MFASRLIAGVSMAVAMSWAAFANAQVAGTGSNTESDVPVEETPADAQEGQFEPRPMDEITVIAGPQGQTEYELELERQAALRERIYAEIRMRERHEEEMAWRQDDPDLEKPESRIKWGYSPQAEQRMRRENDFMHELSIDHNKPASVFRVEF